MTERATGTFQPSFEPLESGDDQLGRMRVAKTFDGDLSGESRAEMLTCQTPVEGSAGYVAIETFSGTLGGRRGSFVMQHNGIMNRGEGTLVISILPDSGTEDLRGIVGHFEILIEEDGGHRYRFDYDLGDGD